MADYRLGQTIGARIAAARRARGFRTTKELALAMENTGITAAVLENIESGRKANLDLSQVLNIAWALEVPFINLLAPMARPRDLLDLPNLGPGLSKMTSGEFDAWISSVPGTGYSGRSAPERNDRSELQAFRELQAAERELRRSVVAQQLEAGELPHDLLEASESRVGAIRQQIDGLKRYLHSAGWEV